MDHLQVRSKVRPKSSYASIRSNTSIQSSNNGTARARSPDLGNSRSTSKSSIPIRRAGTRVNTGGNVIANGEEIDPRALFQTKKLKNCQLWKVPKVETYFYKIKTKNIKKQYYSHYEKETGYDLFCPKCDLFFNNKSEYQEHIVFEGMRKPFLQEAKRMKEKNKEAEEKDKEIEEAIQRRKTSIIPKNRLSHAKGKQATLQEKIKLLEKYGLENKQKKSENVERRKTISKKVKKFSIEEAERKMFSSEDAMEKVMEAKHKRDDEIKRKEEREIRKMELFKTLSNFNSKKNRKTSNRSSLVRDGHVMNNRGSVTTPTAGYRQSLRRESIAAPITKQSSNIRTVESNRPASAVALHARQSYRQFQRKSILTKVTETE